MGLPIEEAQEKISPEEFNSWKAYFMQDPFGYDRIEYMIGMVCSILCNIHRKKGGRTFKPEDFLPKYGSVHLETKKNIDSSRMFMEMFKKRMDTKYGNNSNA